MFLRSTSVGIWIQSAFCKMIFLILCFHVLSPLSFMYPGRPSSALWKANVIAVQYTIWSHYTRGVEAIPPIEKQKEVKEKLKKGQTLIEELNTLLEQIKGKRQTGGSVDKSSLTQALNLKESFKQCKLQSDDLPNDLIENFKKKILETFVMILMNENAPSLTDAKSEKHVSQVHNDL